jgi:hypothetical protein
MSQKITIRNTPEFRSAIAAALKQFNRTRRIQGKKKLGFIPGPDQLILQIPADCSPADCVKLGMFYGVMYNLKSSTNA